MIMFINGIAMKKKIFILIGLLFITGCATVPVTNRSQLILVPTGQIAAESATAYHDLIKKGPLCHDSAKVAQINRVGRRISVAVEKYLRDNGRNDIVKQLHWEFNLIDKDIPNAFCMPGGKVVFYTGILPFTRDDAGVAVVMGHEIAHAVAGHGAERLSQQLVLAGGSVAVSEWSKNSKNRDWIMLAYGIGGELGAMLPYSRLHETEADHIGLIFMAMAGYDPHAAIGFWERMKNAGGAKPPEFLSTHPADDTRIKNLKKFMPEAMKYYRASNKGKTQN